MLTPQSQVFLDAIKTRVVIADGAMGTMIQDAAPSLDDFQGYEGCNEILNVTRPELIESIHAQYLQAGADAIETNTFGANFANLAEYSITERVYELARAGAEVARRAADKRGGCLAHSVRAQSFRRWGTRNSACFVTPTKTLHAG
jgi:5-methyltetrahydrofolate--homocysteine methyltransferase